MVTPHLPTITVPWEQLEDGAADLALRARVTAEYLTDAATAWQRFRSFYQEPDTEERVYTALDELKEPTENWQRSLQDAAEIISAFAAAGRVLEQRLWELQSAVQQQQNQPETDEEQKDAAERQLADQAAALSRDWTDLQETTAAALAGVSYGDGAGLPMGAALGGSAPPAVGWAALTGRLDDRFGALNPDALWPSLHGLDEAELGEWAAANPEAAALLAGRVLTGPYRAGTPEALMRTAMADDAHLSQDGIAGIRTAWLDLSPQDQERLMLLYPAVFGSLNGVPFAQRAKANLITVAGARHTVQAQRDALVEPNREEYMRRGDGGYKWRVDKDVWEAERERLQRQLDGLNYAVKENIQVVMVGIQGNGQIVTMTGAPSADTKIVGTLVPGSGSNLGELASYSQRLDAIDGNPRNEKVGFYWQGTDLPQNALLDNISPKYNETGAPLLAAFDYAVDMEIPSDTRTTYVGYSAGGSLLGTAEREGLDSTNIVYVAPAGPGHEVSRPDDTANSDANRYWLQTRDDYLIMAAQAAGGGSHGGSLLEGGGVGNMGVVRLETGFLDPRDPDSLMGGHMEYFTRDSTAAVNIQGVIEGKKASLYVEDEYLTTADGSIPFSPLEMSPEDYANGKLQTVTMRELEK